MGAHPYMYFAKYHIDIETSLQILREREFLAGRYNPVVSFIEFPLTSDSLSPGAKHLSIEEALEASDADGTRSILDISEVAQISYSEALNSSSIYSHNLYGTSFPLSNDELVYLFDTIKPTHIVVEKTVVLEEQNEEAADEFWQSIDRGTARHIIIYNHDEPVELFFAGYSFD